VPGTICFMIMAAAAAQSEEEAVTISAIVPAAGCGARANLNRNKVLAELRPAGHPPYPVLWWTLRALADVQAMPPGVRLREIIIAARREEFDEIAAVTADLTKVPPAPLSPEKEATSPSHDVPLRIIEGGATRQGSVAAAAQVADGDFLLVHDAARPLVTSQLISAVTECALRDGAAIAALPVSDTVKSVVSQNGKSLIHKTLERQTIWLAQTPQIFRRDILCEAIARATDEGFTGTDCASLVERLRKPNGAPLYPVTVVPGESRNFKVTYAADLNRAASLLITE
jgi:2-C-methyl-D-erythritol 4-phosphate cytidylyltransferase